MIRMQLNQLQSTDPLADDFYFQVHSARKGALNLLPLTRDFNILSAGLWSARCVTVTVAPVFWLSLSSRRLTLFSFVPASLRVSLCAGLGQADSGHVVSMAHALASESRNPDGSPSESIRTRAVVGCGPCWLGGPA